MDPGSGVAAVFEVARSLAALKKSGWMPERTIVFAFWDAEEFGLVGSTEYAEGFARELRDKAVTYINTDLYMRGRFDGGGTPSLRDFLVEVAKDVPSFTGQGSVYDGWRGGKPAEVDLAALGSGADFVAFQDHLGLPTLQMEFDFEGSYGTYHSNYDSRWFVERFSDPGFAVGRTLAQVLGLSVMRLASAPALPFRYSYYGRKVREFLDAAPTWAGAGTSGCTCGAAAGLRACRARGGARAADRCRPCGRQHHGPIRQDAQRSARTARADAARRERARRHALVSTCDLRLEHLLAL
jgi:N-acetylated-alpha-linked acidic dipeptidase